MAADPGLHPAAPEGRFVGAAGGGGRARGLALSIGAHLAIVGLLLVPLTRAPKRAAPPPAPAIAATFVIADDSDDPPPEPRAPARAAPPDAVPPEPSPTVTAPIVALPTTADFAAAPAVPVPVAAGLPSAAEPAAGAPPAPPVVDGGAREASDAERRWERQVLARLERKKRYPAAARRDGLEDTVYLQIRVDRSGRVLARAIQRSRSFAPLDAAALDLVARAAPLPPPPPSVAGAEIDFVVPVTFALNEDRR